jgi:hypothetical protein
LGTKPSRSVAGWGCFALAVVGLASIMGGIFAYTSVVAEATWFPPGDPARFDPVARVGTIQSYAGSGARLLGFEARFVRSDGTLDLTAAYRPGPTVEYRFARSLPGPPKDAAPLGTVRQPDDQWFEPITVKVSRPWELRSVSRSSVGTRSRYRYFNLGMARSAGRPQAAPQLAFAAAPSCSLRDFWKVAAERGAPPQSVAVVRYDPTGYLFQIQGTPILLAFGLDCAPASELP